MCGRRTRARNGRPPQGRKYGSPVRVKRSHAARAATNSDQVVRQLPRDRGAPPLSLPRSRDRRA
eukprot:6313466-Lingulodinium_polyedra.AAC.1